MQTTASKPEITTHVKQTLLPHYVELGYIKYDGTLSGKTHFWYVIPQKGVAIYQGEELNHNQYGERVQYFKDALTGNASLAFYLGELGAKSVTYSCSTSAPRNLTMFTPILEGDIVEELCKHTPLTSKINGVPQPTICAYCRILLK